jgi:hypothetical protein
MTFGFKNLGKEVPTCMSPPQMIMCELLGNQHSIMLSFTMVTQGLVRIGMNYDCVR